MLTLDSITIPDHLNIQHNVDLQPLHTFQLKSKSRFLFQLKQSQILPEILSWAKKNRLPVFILGSGSNLLPDQFINGLIIQMQTKGIRLLEENDAFRLIEANAGEKWHDFVMTTAVNGWSGLENLALIPGTVGAAPVQNIGAYGIEVGQRIDSVIAYDRMLGKAIELSASECNFGYRDSVFKQYPDRWIILSVKFKLPVAANPVLHYGDVKELAGEAPTPLSIANAIIQIRQNKLPDPFSVPNAGSFFKNPLVSISQYETIKNKIPECVGHSISDSQFKMAAGWLIDHCEWKGKNIGTVGMYEKQALVMVNHGGACLEDVKELTAMVQKDVYNQFSILLEPEPVIWSTN